MATIDQLDIQISATTQSATQSIGKLISSLKLLDKQLNSGAVKNFATQMNNASAAMGKMSAQAQKSSAGFTEGAKATERMGAAMNTMPGAVNAFSNSLGRAHKASRSLASVFGSLYANFFWVRRIFSKGIEAGQLYSDLAEVQNVVNHVFDDMAYKLDDFAKTSRSSFGMSELSAKTYASQFQAMFKSMGIGADHLSTVNSRLKDTETASIMASAGYKSLASDASDLSLNMTKLAADMASFYNRNQADVAKQLQAGVISGQVRALRQYGLDLTMATLQQYAFDQGIQKSVQSMTQAEKTMLRYQYVLQNANFALGDFKRTADTMHNQVTLLKENFKALGTVIGRALVGWIKPVIQAINSAMNTIIGLVEKAINAIGKLMGWQVEIGKISGGGGEDVGGGLGDIADDMDDAAGGAGGVAKNLEDANEEAKKLKHQLMGYDEINLIKLPEENEDKDKPDSGGGGGSGKGNGKDGGSGAQTGDVSGGEVTWYKSAIDNWWELGKSISDVLTKAMERIDWEAIYRKASRFGTGLADFLNGLINPELFSALGRTIAGALNTALTFLHDFGDRFDWKNFGNSIAAGINRFFKEFKWDLMAQTLNVWAKGLLDALIEFLDKTDWDQVGYSIGTFIAGIDFVEIGKKVAAALWKAINAGFKVLSGMFDAAPLETALITAVGSISLLGGGLTGVFGGVGGVRSITGGLSEYVRLVTLGVDKQRAFTNTFPLLARTTKVAGGALSSFKTTVKQTDSVTKGLGSMFGYVRNNTTKFEKGLMGVTAGLTSFMSFKSGFSEIAKGTDQLGTKIAGLGLSFVSAGAMFSNVFGFPGGLIAAGITSTIGAISGLMEATMDSVDTKAFDSVGKALSTPGGVPVEDLANHYTELFNAMGKGYKDVADAGEGLKFLIEDTKEIGEKVDRIGFAMENGAIVTESKCTEIKEHFDDLLLHTDSIMKQTSEVIISGLQGPLEKSALAAGTTSEAIIQAMAKVDAAVQGDVDNIKQSQSELDEAYAAGSIGAEEYFQKTYKNTQELERVTGVMGVYKESVDNVTTAIDKASSIDTSKLFKIGEDGHYELQYGQLEAQISQVGKAFEDNVGSIKDHNEVMAESLTYYEEAAKKQQLYAEQSMFSGLKSKDAEEADAAIAQAEQKLTEYANTMLTGFQQDIPAVIDQALADYEGLTPFEKWLTPKDEFVQNAVNQYKSEVIDPFVSEMEGMFDQLGVDGSGFAKDSTEQILSSLFDQELIAAAGGDIIGTKDTLVDNWRQVFEQASEEVKKEAGLIAEGAVEGYTTKIKDPGLIDKGAKETAAWATNGPIEGAKGPDGFDSHSPSRKFEAIGKDVVEGFNKGINENGDTSGTVVVSWISNIVQAAGEAVGTITADMLKTVQDGFKKIVDEVKLRMEEMNLTMTEQYTLILETTTLKFEELSMVVTERMDVVKTTIHDGIKEIEGYFANAKLEFPQIKMPHFTIEETAQNFMGQDIIMPKFNVEWYAQGGFPEDGLFFANSHELVGEFTNGRTAVANNEQIIQGIQRGVYYAVRDAMQDSGGVKVDIEANTQGMFRVMQKKSRQFAKSTGASAFG